MLVFSCYHCGLITDVDESMAGKSWQCPACRQAVTIPAQRSVPRETAWRGALVNTFNLNEPANRMTLQEGRERGLAWTVGLILLGVFLGLLLGGVAGYKLGRRSMAEEAKGRNPPDDKSRSKRLGEPVTYIDAGDLYDCYRDKAYEADSDRALRDRVIEVTGIVSERNDGRRGGYAYVGLFDNEQKNIAVKCYFTGENLDQVTNLSKNQRVRIRGICKSGSTAGVTVDQCEVVE